MINYVKGVLVEKSPTNLIIEVNDIGYQIQVTLNCSQYIGEIGEKVTLLTYLHVKEDGLQLYGFTSIEERQLFEQLISSPGIGPKKAIVILSGSTVEDLQRYIIDEDVSALTSLSGVGKKTAQRLIVDLKEKLVTTVRATQSLSRDKSDDKRKVTDEAILALLSLGYKPNVAEQAVQSVLSEKTTALSLEELIKEALKRI
jgi:holliday junction DNA helicase RuvA